MLMVEIRVVGGKRSGSVPGWVAAHDAEVFAGRFDSKTSHHPLDRLGAGGTPRSVGMEAPPFIQKDALGAFKQHPPRQGQAVT